MLDLGWTGTPEDIQKLGGSTMPLAELIEDRLKLRRVQAVHLDIDVLGISPPQPVPDEAADVVDRAAQLCRALRDPDRHGDIPVIHTAPSPQNGQVGSQERRKPDRTGSPARLG